MFELRKHKLLVVMLAGIFLMNACGGASSNQAEISTAVAQTVQAQNSLTEIASLPTSTPDLPTPSLDTTVIPGTAETLPAATNTLSPNPGCVLSANLIQEDPPDGKILKPGESFLKTWWLQNTGTCTWDKTYKLVYWDGELMGGAVVYDLPVVVPPGETKEVAILLQAPATDGQFRGYWRLRSPWGYDFGVGPGSQSFYVDILVSSDPGVGYGVTAVSYDYVRNPLSGCPSNPITYTFSAKVTTNGPVKIKYHWEYSDGGQTETFSVVFDEAGTKTLISEPWGLRIDAKSEPRSVSFVTTSPQKKAWGSISFTHICP